MATTAWIGNSSRAKGYIAADGVHEIPVTTTQNGLGQTVVSPGGIYQGTNPHNLVPITGTVGTARTAGTVGVPGAGSGTGAAKITNSTTNARGNAESAYQDALKTLMGGVDAATNVNRDHIVSSDADLTTARQSAAGMTPAITNMNNTALALTPYADSIFQNGDSLSRLAQALLSGDASVGGMAGDYLGATRDAADALAALSPERYVSRAASDVQASFDNAIGQQNRELARRGVNVGSGASATLAQQLKRSLATALASAKTNAWMQGENERIDALTKRAGLFKDVLATGQSASQQATQDFATAAGIVQKQGDMFGEAGTLAGQQASAYANIGGVEVNLGNLELNNQKLVQDAIANVASAQQAMAKFYQDMMDTETTTTKVDYGNMSTTTQTTKRI